MRTAVIGGGVAGIEASISAGGEVTLFEKGELGGKVMQITRLYPGFECGPCMLHPLINAIQVAGVDIRTGTEIVDVEATEEGYHLTDSDGEAHGPFDRLIIATGFELYDPSNIEEYRYNGETVITSLEFEPMVHKTLGAVAFINCAGSRDERRLPYCSKYCCSASLKQAIEVVENGGRAVVFYIDIRTDEALYRKAREKGVVFLRGRPSEVMASGDKAVVRAETSELGMVEEEFGIVVLSLGAVPSPKVEDWAAKLGIHIGEDGFVDPSHPLLGVQSGDVITVGSAMGPLSVYEITASTLKVPLTNRVAFDEEKCSHCPMLCMKACPFDAIDVVKDEEGFDIVHQTDRCYDCALCVEVCMSGAFTIDGGELSGSGTIVCERGRLGEEWGGLEVVPCTHLPGAERMLEMSVDGDVLVCGCHGEAQVKAVNRLLKGTGRKVEFRNLPAGDVEGFNDVMAERDNDK